MSLKFSTKLVGSGKPGSIVPPFDGAKSQPWKRLMSFPTSPYIRSSPSETILALEQKIADLHGKEYVAVVMANGQACTNALLWTIEEGGHVLCAKDVYGATISVVDGMRGVSNTFVDLNKRDLEAKVRDNTKYLILEDPSNPLLKVLDLKEIQKFSEDNGVKWILDNTFATMFLIDGFEYGAHAVYYSLSKGLSGHHDLVGGVIVTKDYDLAGELGEIRRKQGYVMDTAIAGKINTYLQTFELRMRRQCDNAAEIAGFLEEHPQVGRVYYPGLESNEGHKIAKEQWRALDGKENKYGGVVSFEVLGDHKAFANYVAQQSEINNFMYLAESLGSNVSLLAHPATMSHRRLEPERRREMGIKDNLFRFSVGIADVEDIKYVLSGALDASKNGMHSNEK